MTVEERLELLPKLLALVNHLDVAHMESQPEHKAEKVSEPEAETKEDFVASNG